VPAVRQKLHLSSCADFRDRLLTIRSQETALSQVITYGDTPTADQSMQEAKNLIDKGMIR
jgi:hypothetical protein